MDAVHHLPAVLRAHNLKNYTTFGSQDVYCTLRCGNEQRTTRIVTNGGAAPNFSGEPLSAKSMFQEVATLEVWSRRGALSDDKLIGSATIKLEEV